MSTLPGQASKGEKSKPKYQFLDINNLYRNSRVRNALKCSLIYDLYGQGGEECRVKWKMVLRRLCCQLCGVADEDECRFVVLMRL